MATGSQIPRPGSIILCEKKTSVLGVFMKDRADQKTAYVLTCGHDRVVGKKCYVYITKDAYEYFFDQKLYLYLSRDSCDNYLMELGICAFVVNEPIGDPPESWFMNFHHKSDVSLIEVYEALRSHVDMYIRKDGAAQQIEIKEASTKLKLLYHPCGKPEIPVTVTGTWPGVFCFKPGTAQARNLMMLGDSGCVVRSDPSNGIVHVYGILMALEGEPHAEHYNKGWAVSIRDAVEIIEKKTSKQLIMPKVFHF